MTAILTKKPKVICFVAFACAACSARAPLPNQSEVLGSELVADAGPMDAERGVSEALARELLNRMFRARGLRVLNDVPWQRELIEVTLDGFDPKLEIGFEYVAREERNTELAPAELEELKTHPRIFVSGPATAAELQARAQVFLDRLAPPER